MEKRVSYYVSRKSFLVWLSALVMTASAALRIAYSCGKGADASTVWFQIVLPAAACLIFVLMILLGGEERFYRTAIPAFMLAIYYSVRVSSVLPSLSLRFVFWVAYLAMAGLYAVTVSGQQVYSRGDDIQFCMMVKEDMTTDAAESAMKLHLTPTDSVEDIYRKMNEQVTRIKEASDASDFDKTAKLLSLIPGVVFKFVVWLLKVADYFGLLPKF